MDYRNGDTWALCKSIISKAIIGTIVLAVCFLVLIDNWMPWVSGLFFGSIFGILNFRLLALTLEKSVSKSPKRIQVYVMSRYMVRYVLTGIVLFVGFKADYMNIIAVIVGMFLVKLAILIDQLIIKKKY